MHDKIGWNYGNGFVECSRNFLLVLFCGDYVICRSAPLLSLHMAGIGSGFESDFLVDTRGKVGADSSRMEIFSVYGSRNRLFDLTAHGVPDFFENVGCSA